MKNFFIVAIFTIFNVCWGQLSGEYVITSKMTAKAFDVAGGKANFSYVIHYPLHYQSNQIWQIKPVKKK